MDIVNIKLDKTSEIWSAYSHQSEPRALVRKLRIMHTELQCGKRKRLWRQTWWWLLNSVNTHNVTDWTQNDDSDKLYEMNILPQLQTEARYGGTGLQF